MSGVPQLDQLAAALEDLQHVPSRAASAASERISGLLAEQFAGGFGPEGDWDPLLESTIRRKGGDARILIRSGEAQANTFARPAQGAGIEIQTLDYMSYHQSGTQHMAARPILPEDELPEEWLEIIDEEVEAAFGRAQ